MNGRVMDGDCPLKRVRVCVTQRRWYTIIICRIASDHISKLQLTYTEWPAVREMETDTQENERKGNKMWNGNYNWRL